MSRLNTFARSIKQIQKYIVFYFIRAFSITKPGTLTLDQAEHFLNLKKN